MRKIFLTLQTWIFAHKIKKQILFFLIVGSFSTIISYSTFLISLKLFHLHYLIANVVGFVCSISVNYYCNRRWTFESRDKRYFYRYFTFYLISLGLSSLLLNVLVEFVGIIPEIANILTIAAITGVNFLGTKLLIFKK